MFLLKIYLFLCFCTLISINGESNFSVLLKEVKLDEKGNIIVSFDFTKLHTTDFHIFVIIANNTKKNLKVDILDEKLFNQTVIFSSHLPLIILIKFMKENHVIHNITYSVSKIRREVSQLKNDRFSSDGCVNLLTNLFNFTEESSHISYSYSCISQACLNENPPFQAFQSQQYTARLDLCKIQPYSRCKLTYFLHDLTQTEIFYDEINFNTSEAINEITEKEEPTNVTFAFHSKDIIIVLPECRNFLRKLSFEASIQCVTEWCNNKTIINLNRYNLLNENKFKAISRSDIQANCQYNVTVTISSSLHNKTKVLQFTTLTGPPNLVDNITEYYRTERYVWVKFSPPHPPTGELDTYEISSKSKQPLTNEDFKCEPHFVCKKVELSISTESAIYIRSKNKSPDNFSDYAELELKNFYSNDSIPPTNISLNWPIIKRNNILDLEFDSPYLKTGPFHVMVTIDVNSKTVSSEICAIQKHYRFNISDSNFDNLREFNVAIKTYNHNETYNVFLDVIGKIIEELDTKKPIIQWCQGKLCKIKVPKPVGNFKIRVTNRYHNCTVTKFKETNNAIVLEMKGDHNEAVSLNNRSYSMQLIDESSNTIFNLVDANTNEENHKNETKEQHFYNFFIPCLILAVLSIAATVGFWIMYGRREVLFPFNVKAKPQNSITIKMASMSNLLKIEQENEIFQSSILNCNENDIRVKDYETYINNLFFAGNNEKLNAQFEGVPFRIDTPQLIGNDENNKKKNRYKDIIPYDHSLVKLSNGGYINANYIPGYQSSRDYIATQAPLDHTIDDFWKMVWEHKVSTIVMLTNFVENGKRKAGCYWPKKSQLYDTIKIVQKSETKHSHYVHRTFELLYNRKTRQIDHFHYFAWPDMSSPMEEQNCAQFMHKIPNSFPILVHCSAGCGRTGAFILIHINLRMAAEENKVNIFDTFKRMREHRLFMVQKLNQYAFVYFTLYHILCEKDYTFPVDEGFGEKCEVASKQMKDLICQLNKASALSHLRQGAAKYRLSEADCRKNRFSHLLPGPQQLYLEASAHYTSNYINACVVNCYAAAEKFMVTQNPLPETVEDFWRLVTDYESPVIVSLNNVGDNNNAPIFWPQFKHIQAINPFIGDVKNVDVEVYTNYDVVTLQFVKTMKKIRLIQVKNWKFDNALPDRIDDLIEIWKDAWKWSSKKKIVVTCYDGTTASGFFVALSHLIEKLNVEQICDVYSAAKCVKQSRLEFLSDESQIEALYKIARLYIEAFSDYTNFY